MSWGPRLQKRVAKWERETRQGVGPKVRHVIWIFLFTDTKAD